MQNKQHYENIMKDHAERQLAKKNLNENTVFEGDTN